MELEEIDPILKQMVQEYQIYVFSLEELQEEYFQTNLRELIGLMKRRSSKTKIQEYCRKHQQNGRGDLRYDLRDVKSERTTGQERKISGKRKGVY